jgi:outer membrane protein TolC
MWPFILGFCTLSALHNKDLDLLSLDEAIRQALLHQPQIASSQGQVTQEENKYLESQQNYYPQIAFSAQSIVSSAEQNRAVASFGIADLARITGIPPNSPFFGENPYRPWISSIVGLGMHQSVWDFGRTQNKVRAARSKLKSQEFHQKSIEQYTVSQVMLAYFKALAASEYLAIAEDLYNKSKEHTNSLNTALQEGLASVDEQERAHTELLNSEFKVLEYHNQLSVERSALDYAIGWVEAPVYTLPKFNETMLDMRPISVSSAEQQALSSRPDLQVLIQAEQSSQFQASAQRSDYFPELIASASVVVQGLQSLPNSVNWNAGMILKVPIFNGLATQAKYKMIYSQKKQIQADRQALENRIRHQVRVSYYAFYSAEQAYTMALSRFKKEDLKLQKILSEYRQGLMNHAQIYHAQVQYQNLRSEMVKLRLAMICAYVQLLYTSSYLKVPSLS